MVPGSAQSAGQCQGRRLPRVTGRSQGGKLPWGFSTYWFVFISTQRLQSLYDRWLGLAEAKLGRNIPDSQTGLTLEEASVEDGGMLPRGEQPWKAGPQDKDGTTPPLCFPRDEQ